MGDSYERAPMVGEGRIGGIVAKPRRDYVPTTMGWGGDNPMAGFGQPVFDPAGRLAGLTVGLFETGSDSTDSMDDLGFLLSLSSSVLNMAVLIMPTSEIERATERALAADEAP